MPRLKVTHVELFLLKCEIADSTLGGHGKESLRLIRYNKVHAYAATALLTQLEPTSLMSGILRLIAKVPPTCED